MKYTKLNTDIGNKSSWLPTTAVYVNSTDQKAIELQTPDLRVSNRFNSQSKPLCI
jgi:hypothetical protein